MPLTEITVDGITLRGTVTGAGPTVLLLHAGGERRGVWAPVAMRMALCGLRTVAFDLRGHGESSGQARTLRAVAGDVREMVARETGPIVVAGTSLGGLAALVALADPAVARRVAGLVLVDVVPEVDLDRFRRWRDEQGLRDLFSELVADILGQGAALLAGAATLDLPILLVRAGKQSPFGDADVDRFRAVNHHVAVTTVPEAGHLIARDAPAELARILTNQASTWLGTEDVVRRALELQHTLGAGRLDHPGGTLDAHLLRVHAQAAEWNAAPRARLAAICHATYGTDGFGQALLPVTERSRLEHVIGSDAEALVYLYGACDRARTYRALGRRHLPVFDRFTGQSREIQGIELRDFAVLTIANELDVARHAQLPGSARKEIRALVAALASYAPAEAAWALADVALAQD
ncbi:alpha/beta fold hydrolase [Nocardia sp. NPDC050712]|uniref:alpha/beta fold hydrolase n=1 Tax=Nocardia sp. NPDC050712 TaxID=3155518 RepID=UPI0033FE87C2